MVKFARGLSLMPRYNLQIQDLASLANYVTELRRIADSLDGYLASMKQDGFVALEVPNNTIGMRGLEYTSKFVESVRQSHIAARANRGDYLAEKRRKTNP